MLTSGEGQIASSTDLYNLLNLGTRASSAIGIMADTSIQPQTGSVESISHQFVLKATALGGAFLSKTIDLTITVCGGEVLSLASLDTQVYSIDIPMNGATHTTIDPLSFFSTTDSDCPSIEYAVYNSVNPNVAPSALELTTYQIDQGSLKLLPTELGTYTFILEGKTVSGKVAYKNIELTVTCGAGS